MEVIKVILIFILFQILLIFILKTIGRTYIYKYIFLNKKERTCLKIMDTIEYEFSPTQNKLLQTYRKIKPLVKQRFIMGENQTDSFVSRLRGEEKHLMRFSVEMICETIKGAIYKEVNVDGLTSKGQDYFELYKQALIFLVTKGFYSTKEEKLSLESIKDGISILSKVHKKEFSVIDEFRNVIYPKYVFTLIDTGEDKLLITDFRSLISFGTFSQRDWKIFKNSKFRYFYYRDYLMRN